MSLLKLSPSYKDYIWGGHRLVEEYHKKYEGDILAESWELSCHPDGPSYLAEGSEKGLTLTDIFRRMAEMYLARTASALRIFRS